MRICFYGASSRSIDVRFKEEVEKLAQKCARRGHELVFGAGIEGCMGAAARGFQKENRRITGVVPRFFNTDGILFPDCTEMIFTDTMRERKELLENLSDAYVVAPGGIGTLDEFFEILCLKQLGQNGKALALFNPLGFFDSLAEFLKSAAEMHFMNERVNKKLYQVFSDPDELIDYLENFRPTDLSVEELKDVGVRR